MNEQQPKRTILGSGTGVSISLVLLIVGTLGGFAWRMNSETSAVQAAFAVHNAQQEATFQQIKTQIDILSRQLDGQWTIAQQEAFSLRMAMENPGIRVPDPRNPGRFLAARNGQPANTP